MYTSGTTGAPKGVMLTNDNYFCKATGIAEKWRFDADSVSLAVMPMFHMAGSGWALVGLCEGRAPLCCVTSTHPRSSKPLRNMGSPTCYWYPS